MEYRSGRIASVQEFPGVRAIETPDVNRLQNLRVEDPQVHAVTSPRFRRQWFPVRNASACGTTHRAERSVALDVCLRVLGMTGDANCAELVVGPDTTDAPANGTVAARSRLWSRWQLDRDSATVAASYKHVVMPDARIVRPRVHGKPLRYCARPGQ